MLIVTAQPNSKLRRHFKTITCDSSNAGHHLNGTSFIVFSVWFHKSTRMHKRGTFGEILLTTLITILTIFQCQFGLEFYEVKSVLAFLITESDSILKICNSLSI